MNKQSYIYLGITIALSILWIFFIYRPYNAEYEKLSQEILSNEAKLADFELTIQKIPEFLKHREELKKKREFLNSRLYTKEEVINLFNLLHEEAIKLNLKITEITPPIEELLYLNDIIPDSTKPQFLNIGVDLVGDYKNFGEFVKEIESESFFRGINNCRVSGSKELNSSLDLHIGFKALLGRIGDAS